MAGKTLIYDGDCTFCRVTVAVLVGLRLVASSACRSSRDLDPEELDRLRGEGLRNEMVVLGPAGEPRRGAAGLLWMLRDGWGAPFGWFLGLPGVRSVSTLAYRVISYNRRALAPPPPRGVRCDCDPDPHTGYRAAFTVLCTLFAAGVLFLVRDTAPRWGSGGAQRLLQYGGSFLLMGVLAAARGREDYLPHLAATAACGAAVLLPSALFPPSSDAARVLFVYGHFAAFILMTWLHGRHLAFLGMGAAAQLAWILLVPAWFLGVGAL